MSLDKSWKMLTELEKVSARHRLWAISRKPLEIANHTELLGLDPMITSRNSTVRCYHEKWCVIDVATKMSCCMGLKCPSAVFPGYPLALWRSSYLGAAQYIPSLMGHREVFSSVTVDSKAICDVWRCSTVPCAVKFCVPPLPIVFVSFLLVKSSAISTFIYMRLNMECCCSSKELFLDCSGWLHRTFPWSFLCCYSFLGVEGVLSVFKIFANLVLQWCAMGSYIILLSSYENILLHCFGNRFVGSGWDIVCWVLAAVRFQIFRELPMSVGLDFPF